MQIHNFYSDWLPAPSSALDTIVLSPHTIKADDLKLSGLQDDYCDCHSRVYANEPSYIDPFAPAPANPSCAGHLKKCMQWFRSRRLNRRER